MSMLATGTLQTLEAEISNAIGRPRYDLWFGSNTSLSLHEGELEIGVPNRFYREWLESHFQKDIQSALHRAFDEPIAVRFRIDPTLFRRIHSGGDVEPKPAEGPRAPLAPAVGKVSAAPSRFALTRFLVGGPNKVAHAAAASLVEDPRSGYSPLFLHGGVGLGKTHLLKGIEDGLKQRRPDLRAMMFSCEEFTNRFLDALRSGKLPRFRKQIRQLDVLIVDDVQFLCGKKATLEEFFHTLNALEARGAKVVLSADTHPRRLTRIPDELRARFLAGMVAKLDSPTRELRRQLLLAKAADRRLNMDREVYEFLADHLRSNVREIEGALNYLEHYSDTLARSIDLVTARNVLSEILRDSIPMLRPAEIEKRACDFFGLSAKAIRQRSRTRAVSHPRMLILYLARKHTKATYCEIGQRIGGLNHSTVIAAEKKIAQLMAEDKEILLGDRSWKARDAVEAFERQLGG